MKPRHRWLRGGAAIALLAIVVASFAWWQGIRRAAPRPVMPAPALGSSEQRARTNAYVDVLSSETLDESINRLLDSQQHQDPGFHAEGRKGAQRNLGDLLGNRRSRKVLAELRDLPREERVARCERAFGMLLDRHAQAFIAAARHIEEPTAPENTQSLMSTQLALGTILLATAQAGDRELLRRELRRLQEHRAFIEERLAGKPFEASFVAVARGYATPDLRCQLHVLRELAAATGEAGKSRQIDELCRDLTMRKAVVTPWDSRLTWVDVLRQMQHSPLDARQDVDVHRTLDWPGDMLNDTTRQQELVDKVSAVVGVAVGN